VVKPRKISEIKSTLMNVAQTSHYEVMFGGFPSSLLTTFYQKGLDSNFIGRKLGLLCYSATLPGSSLATMNIEGNFTGVQQQYAHTRIFNNITLDFYCDSKYKVLKFFEAWIQHISGAGARDQRSRGYFYRMRFPDQYKCEGLRISKFDRDYANGVQYNFISAFPVSVSGTPVSYEASNSIMRVSVDFNFDRYIFNDDGSFVLYPWATPKSVSNLTDINNSQNNLSANNVTELQETNSALTNYFTAFNQSGFDRLSQKAVDDFIFAKDNWNPTTSATSDVINFVSTGSNQVV
jgi:hypothetical protein